MSTSNLIISNRKTDIERNGQNSEVQAFAYKDVMKYNREMQVMSRGEAGVEGSHKVSLCVMALTGQK